MTPLRKAAAERSGHRAEAIAVLWLSLKGYRVLERRCHTAVGEIDIIAVRRRRIAFVEVKRRASLDDAAWSVTPRQQARIARAAEYWLARKPAFHGHDVAFDVVLVSPPGAAASSGGCISGLTIAARVGSLMQTRRQGR